MRPARSAKPRRKTRSNTAGRAKPRPAGNEFLKSLFALSSDWYWEQDENLRFTQFTGRGLLTAHIDTTEWLGKTRWEMSGLIFDAETRAAVEAKISAREPYDFEYQRVEPDGSVRWITTSGTPIFDAAGRFAGYHGIAKDVTERRRGEQLLALEHAVNRRLVDAKSVSDGIRASIRAVCESEGWECGRYFRVDDGAGALHFAEAWALSDELMDRVVEKSRELSHAPGTGLIGRVWQSGQPIWNADVARDGRPAAEFANEIGALSVIVFPVLSENKTIGVFDFMSSQIRQPDDRFLQAARVIGTQVGQFLRRKYAEEEQFRFRAALDNSADMIVLIDRKAMRFVDVNETACRLLGYSREELLTMGPQDVLPTTREELERVYDEFIADRSNVGGMHSYYICKNGSTLPFESTRRVLRSGDGYIIAAISRDIRERLATEADLLRFRTAMDTSADMILLVDRATMRYVDINSTACEMHGYTREEMLKLGPQDLTLFSLEELERSYDHAIASGETMREQGYQRRKDGTTMPVEIHRRAVRAGERWIIVAIVRDVTERLAAEEALRESEARFRAIVDSANEGILVYDRALQVIGGNAAAERIIGVPLADIIGAADFTSLLPCVHEDGCPLKPEDRPTRITVRTGQPQTARILGIERSNGSVTWLSVNTGFLRRSGESEHYGVVSTFGDITEQRQAETALRESEARFRSLTDLSSDWFWEQDARFRFTRLEGQHPTGKRSGFESELGKTRREIGVEVDGGWEAHQALLDARQPFRDVVMRRTFADGKLRYMSISGEPKFDGTGRFIGYRGVGKDITERKLTERATVRLGRMYSALSAANEAILRAGSPEELYQRLCDAAVRGGQFYSAALFLADPASPWIKLAAASGAVTDIWQRVHIAIDEKYPEGRGLTGTAFRTQTPQVCNDYLNDERTRPWHKLVEGIGVQANAVLPLIRHGASVGALILYSNERDAFDDDMIKLLVRITENLAVALDNFDRDDERKQAEKRIKYLATHDGLTDLPNRVMFSEMLNLAIQSARRYDRRFAVLFIDLDRFKIINDTLGHEAGDTLLNKMAKRLRENLRASDVVARLGGDEFVVLLQEATNEEQVATVARKLLSVIIKPVTILGQECRVTASIGISMFPTDAHDEQSLMKNADVAMYLAKEEGKNNFQFYPKDTKPQSLERLTLETNLRQALDRDEFFLEYQAKLDLETDTITGVEALLRWQHPDRGVLSPAQFIPLAEETGLIVPIGKRVLRTACAQNVAWQRAGLPPVRVAVNLSPRQFVDENLLNDIAAALAESGMAPELLELEITESMVMGNVERAARQLTTIKQMGVRLAIDDFGTGYSSLAEIKRFPIDTIKVDRSFVREIPHDAEDKAITQAIIALGRSLSLTVVAEGVETEQQQTFLREHACDEIQGYYFSRPVAPDRFAELLRTHVPRTRRLRKA
jgi:diguanylate cyclase (GGDEF)-like protein/PAS domain S-box-containing protein